MIDDVEEIKVSSSDTADSYIIATAHDEEGYGFGYLCENNGNSLKGYLGTNLGPKLAGLSSPLLFGQQIESATVGMTTSLTFYLDQITAIKALKSNKAKSKLAHECIDYMNRLAGTRGLRSSGYRLTVHRKHIS